MMSNSDNGDIGTPADPTLPTPPAPAPVVAPKKFPVKGLLIALALIVLLAVAAKLG